MSSPLPSGSFVALEDNDTSIPPDTFGAVSPEYLVVTLNSEVRIQTRSGDDLGTVDTMTFWAAVGEPETSDPRVFYDTAGETWIFTAMGDPELAGSSVLIAASKESDPQQGWFLNRIDVDSANRVWLDHPTTGFDSRWVVVQGNLFSVRNGSFQGTRIYVFDKSALYAGGAAPHTTFTRLDIGVDQLPAVTFDESLSDLYMVSSWDGNANGEGNLRIFRISGDVGFETLSLGAFATVSSPWAAVPRNLADFLPQRGSARRISAGDDAIGNVVYRNGSLWAAHTIFLPATNSPTRSAIQWWEIAPDGTMRQVGRIDDPGGRTFYAYPSIAVNRDSDVLIGYSRFSSAEYASAAYSFRAGTDPAGTLRDEVILKAGEASYFKTFGGNSNRWGDYSNTVVDPANDTDFWTIQEYAATPVGGVDRWGTWWGRIEPPPRDVLFTRGDPNDDGRPDISDATVILLYLFEGSAVLSCLKSADADGDGAINIADAVFLLGYLFQGGPAPPAPFPGCDIEAVSSPLSCESYSSCA